MATAHKVVLYGDTIVLAAVGKSLQRYPGLEVISVCAAPKLAGRELDNLHPDAVILDLGVVTKEFAFELLRERPGLMVIGLNAGGDRLLVLSGELARSLTTKNLVWLIENGVPMAGEANGRDHRRPNVRLTGSGSSRSGCRSRGGTR